MVGHTLLLEERRSPEWIITLLHTNSFGHHCDSHQHLKYHEKNFFCIDCELSLCRHCKENHTLHRMIQIYKYVHLNVVRHSDLQNYFNCSRIQTYISNHENVIQLNQRPPTSDKCADVGTPETQSQYPKVLRKARSGGGTCKECGRRLQDERNHFCSISCKISVLSAETKSIKSPKPEVSDRSLNDNQISETESSISEAEPYERAVADVPRKRSRKSSPCRSPPF